MLHGPGKCNQLLQGEAHSSGRYSGTQTEKCKMEKAEIFIAEQYEEWKQDPAIKEIRLAGQRRYTEAAQGY